MENKTIKLIVTAILVVCIFVSFFALSGVFSSPETYDETIATLDEKSNNVLALATTSAAISTGLTMLPGDTASPMADQIADLSSTMMIIMCAIFLEKYLLTFESIDDIPASFVSSVVYTYSHTYSSKATVSTA